MMELNQFSHNLESSTLNILEPYIKVDSKLTSEIIVNPFTGEMPWLVKATLNPQIVKLKTSDQKEERKEDQQEQESSTQPSDQKSPRKEQKPKTKSTSKPQFVISYPDGAYITHKGEQRAYYLLAEDILGELAAGEDVLLPKGFTLQVIYREDLE